METTELQPESDVEELEPLRGNNYPLWSPRFWNGMTLRDYLRLLYQGRFKISPHRWHLGIITLLTSLFNSLVAIFQTVFFGLKIRRCKKIQSPVFVIGHFRTGTTMLFEHLACDKQFVFPTTYQCFSPRHFLVTQWCLPKLISLLLPNRRPMDNMQAGLERPQEDEFGILSMAAPTIYHRLAFPNQPTMFVESLTFEKDTPTFRRWKKQMLWFYRAICIAKPAKRLLIKSPCHTGRIARLLELFPDAKFIHITRDPREVFPSIRNTWRVLQLIQAFQSPQKENQLDILDQFIFETLNEMYRGFWKSSDSISSEQLCHVRYEDLVKNPVEEMQRVYSDLSLGDFESVRSSLEERCLEVGEYQTNRFTANPALVDQINKRWSEYLSRYDYDK